VIVRSQLELSVVLNTIRAYEDLLMEMNDVEFTKVVRDYAERLVKDVEAQLN
jgi:hypothetical protein